MTDNSQPPGTSPKDGNEGPRPATTGNSPLAESLAGSVKQPSNPPTREERDWSAEELELLYQQALDAMQAVESDLSAVSSALSADEDSDDRGGGANVGAADLADAGQPPEDASPVRRGPSAPEGDADQPQRQNQIEPEPHNVEPAVAADEADNAKPSTLAGNERVSPKQVVEAALFVGGSSLTAKKLCSLFRGEFDQAYVEQTLDKLNQQYREESRPYEIRMSEGGYRLVLKPEFEPLRHRVFGTGPKEIKLSRDVLEVLALVAYKQPISREGIEQLGKENAAAALRQLLRRELVAIERAPANPKDVKYCATPRFLQLFGLASFEELPQAEAIDLK